LVYNVVMSPCKRKWKIGIAIPAPQQVHPNFALSNLPSILSYTKDKFPKSKLIVKYQTGVRTDSNRNLMVKELLEMGVDFILHLDADEIYPQDIIEAYLLANNKDPIDVIGAYYFKRSYPYNPVAYVLNERDDKNIKPYREMLPQFVERGVVYECAGLGFGGMFVARHVYEKLGDDKWANYGKNFHIPEEMEDKLTHDLNFCKSVKSAGMSVRLHGSVRPAHIGEILITEKDYIDNMEIELKRVPDILVIMPHIDEELATKTANLMRVRAGVPHKMLLVEDKKRQGFVKTINTAVRNNKAELYVYTAQDAFVSRNWLYEAIMCQAKHMAEVVSFNDGKWDGAMAQFGLVTHNFLKNYDGNLFPDCYNCNYCDVEITQVAKQQGRYAWAEKAIMMEIDYVKDLGGKKVNMDDKALYNERKKTHFDGKVTNEDLLKEFS
jgi:hypothetical protein